MTEPQVLPAEPKVKPTPKREAPEPKPRKGDPWTVPGPKKNPTPKAVIIKEMTNNKKLISTKASLDFINTCMPNATIKMLFDKFNWTPEMTVKIIAAKAMKEINGTDRLMTSQEVSNQEVN
jgi:hypothetical protein